MTHMFKHHRTAEMRIAVGQWAYINVWRLSAVDGLHAGDAHWTREAANKGLNDAAPLRPDARCLYRVVVRPKALTDDPRRD